MTVLTSKNQGFSIFSVYLISILIIMFLLMFLMTALNTMTIFSRLDEHINNLLDRSLVVAWQEYDTFFQKTESILRLMAPTFDQKSKDEMAVIMDSQPDIDFWLVFDRNMKAIAGNLDTANLPPELNELAASSIARRITIHTSEALPTKYFANSTLQPKHDFLIELKEGDEGDFYVQDNKKLFAWTLVRATAVPVVSAGGSIRGCLVAGDLVNNDQLLPDNYSNKIDGSYLSIGIKGVRVVSNIESTSQLFFLGTHQHDELVKTVTQGQRYSGEALMEPGDIHLIASEPITNANGEIVGALSVGVPSKGIATVKQDAFFAILLSLAVCLIIALVTATFLARSLTRPLASLTTMTKNIAEAQELITPGQLREFENKSAFRIKEINHLLHYLQQMAKTIYQKSMGEKEYLAALEAEQCKLQQLTKELQASNILLEKKVSEQTSELRQAVINLKALDEMKTKFLANMSHELRTPLNSIIGFAEMLHDEIFGELNPTQKDYTNIILNSARDLLQIISDILDIARVEQGELSLDKGFFSVDELVSSIITIIKPQIKSKDQKLTVRIEPDLPHLYGDQVRIKQVLYNLLSNAHKFTPPGGKISVTADLINSQIKISVSDNGIGIEKKHLDHIFDEFYQSETLYESKYEGVGLGLPLSKKLVELHDGKIELESKVGKGTTVSFTLPVSKQGSQ